jgi:glycosyltransferase involved in cell wall biosynthesis
MLKRAVSSGMSFLLVAFFLLKYFILLPYIRRKKRMYREEGLNPRLVWGPIPLINNKYWSNSLRKEGFDSATIVNHHYSIYEKDDFDIYFDDIVPKIIRNIKLSPVVSSWIVFLYAIKNYEIFHHSFAGGFLGNTLFWRWEAQLMRWAGCKSVIIPFGSDAYRYSRIRNISFQEGLLMNYSALAKREEEIERRISYWSKRGDGVFTARMLPDGFNRTDALAFSMITVDTEVWKEKDGLPENDGEDGVVKVVHTPNHRGCKGTEFLVHAVEELKSEGLLIELLLLEGVANSEVRRIMQEEADILAEQFINVGYGLSGIEGMASGLPVLANLEDNECYTRAFRRYSYLDECPILSATPETLKENLRVLVNNPKLRKELGQAGRKYVEKYHSEVTAQYMFKAIYDKIWHAREIDLMDLFHPMKSKYNKQQSLVKHPLQENKLPESYFSTDNKSS